MSYSNVHLTGESHDSRYFGVKAEELEALKSGIESTSSGKFHFTYQGPTPSSPQGYFFDASPLFSSSDVVNFFGNSGRLRKNDFVGSSTDNNTEHLTSILKTNNPVTTNFFKPLEHSHVFMRGEYWGDFETIKPSFRLVQNDRGVYVASVSHLSNEPNDVRKFKFGGISWDQFDLGATERGVDLEFGKQVLLENKGHDMQFRVPENNAHIKLIVRQYSTNPQSKARFSQLFNQELDCGDCPVTVEAVYDDPNKLNYI
ncbi:hypothetical protein SOPP22_16655 [Shewanella sp. OPT22]|nr:hypothetical protein SOPP22_16655 [Shewanella sp. OPT22]